MIERQNHSRVFSGLFVIGGISSVLTAVVGSVLFFFTIGGGITRLSYDLPFALRGDIGAKEAAIVYLDEASHTELNQPTTAPWDRSIHAKLIDQLTSQGAKAIVFDILFTDASVDSVADEKLAKAIQRSGRVVLAGNYQERETTPGMVARWDELPFEPFRAAAVTWGNANLAVDPDYGVRSFFPPLAMFPTSHQYPGCR